MPAKDVGGYAFLVLLPDEDDSIGLARLLEDVRLASPSVPSVFITPPARGIDFFADTGHQAEIDEWWGQMVPRDHVPVYLLMHEEGLAEWIHGVDGIFYLGVPNPTAATQYENSGNLKPFVANGPLDFATVVMRDFSQAGDDPGGAELFDAAEAMRMAALSSDFPLDLDDTSFDFGMAPEQPVADPYGGGPFAAGPAPGRPLSSSPTAFPPMPGMPSSPFAPGPFDATLASGQPLPQVTPRPKPASTPVATPHPFDLLTQGSGTPVSATPADEKPWEESPLRPLPDVQPPGALPLPPAPAPSPAPSSSPAGASSPPPWPGTAYPAAAGNGGQRGLKFTFPISLPSLGSLPFGRKSSPRGAFVPMDDRQLATFMIERGPTIVAMGSRKGGVGKTSFAAGVAIIAGEVLDQMGHKAAIVDANIANPDAWGQMNLPPGAATAREVVAALTANREPPPPAHASTPALACYPESREATEYSKTDIKRFADYLRRRYTFIVVDLTNRLPDPMAGPESAAAAYWLEHADVLVLPTTSDKKDFNGVLDYLDVRNLPPTVVPYIVPTVRRNREHAVTQEYLNVIRSRVHRIVEVPEESDKVRLAGMEGVPVQQVSASLRSAYRELTEVIARIPAKAPK